MKIAIPIFKNHISPRFLFAPQILILTLKGKKIVHQEIIVCHNWRPCYRVQKLSELKVDLVICGGIERGQFFKIKQCGIDIISFVWGTVQEVILAYLNDSIENLQTMQNCHKQKINKK